MQPTRSTGHFAKHMFWERHRCSDLWADRGASVDKQTNGMNSGVFVLHGTEVTTSMYCIVCGGRREQDHGMEHVIDASDAALAGCWTSMKLVKAR